MSRKESDWFERAVSLGGRVARVVREEVTGLQPTKLCAELIGERLPHLKFNYVRTSAWRACGLRIGARSRIMGPLHITGSGDFGEQLAIGEDTIVSGPLRIDLAARVDIGSRVYIGHDVMLLTVDHEIGPPEQRCGARLPSAIRVGDGAWLSSRCIVLPGVVVGAGSVVAAGAVVTHDVLPGTLVAGVPARLVRHLDDGSERSERLRLASDDARLAPGE